MSSVSNSFTAATASAGGPALSSMEPTASHVIEIQDFSIVPAARCSFSLAVIRSMSLSPRSLPKAATVCRRATAAGALRSPPIARLSSISLSVGGTCPRRGSDH